MPAPDDSTPRRSPRPRTVVLATLAVLVAAAVLIAACGGGGDRKGASSGQAAAGPPANTPTATATPSPTTPPSSGAQGTPPTATTGTGCRPGTGGYASTVGHYLCSVSARFRQATGPCTHINPPGPCREAAVRYRDELLAARRAIAGLGPPPAAKQADATMRRALDEAIAATRHGIAALDTGDLGRWLTALSELSGAGARLQRAGAQLLDAIS